jgi:biotin carboxylase
MSAGHERHIVLVGSGGQPYREYAFRALAGSYRLSAVLAAEPTWQRPYLHDWRIADLEDQDAINNSLTALLGTSPAEGVLTWDETALERTALAAEKLSLPHMSARSAMRCRDKYLTRSLLSDGGLAAVRYGLASSAAQAARLASAIGYPVVVKPRALAGSIGVVKVTDAAAMAEAFDLATGARFGTLPAGHGVLVEEYLDGPEISVDSVVTDGEVACVHVARKRTGFAPYFEEVGHLVTGWAGEPWAEAVRTLVTCAHRALGVDLGITHAEVRLTSSGPRLVELNGRLGGDLIPYIAWQATGIDLVTAAAELALGHRPDLEACRQRCAEVRFIYPGHDAIVRRVELTEAGAVPGITDAIVLAEPGTQLLLPPRQAIPRLAALIAVADDPQACELALDVAGSAVRTDLDPLSTR